jgi:hypothetical protein
MNTIPTTFNGGLYSYTAIGGGERRGDSGVSAVILNRGERVSRFSLFEELAKASFDRVISIEGPKKRFDTDALFASFPFARFILLKENLSAGEEINLAVSELSGGLFFVLWNDLKILRGGTAGRMVKINSAHPRLCTVPVIQDCRFETIPTLTSPALIQGKAGAFPFAPRADGEETIFPFDGAGMYDRERFIRLGGFDGTIKNFHWQLMDFGFRARLWGEAIAATLQVKLSYEGNAPQSDSTLNGDYRRFYLKNLAPVFRGEYANLPLRRFPGFLKCSRLDLYSAWEEFAEARRWIAETGRHFCCDSRAVLDSWEYGGARGGDTGDV